MSNDSTARNKLLLDIIDSVRAGKNKTLLRAGAGVAALLLLIWLVYPSSGNTSTRYLTEDAAKGDLAVTVSATGNLYPTNQVDVGSELSGIVETVLVDENDRVKRGQVLVRLDLSRLNDQVTKSRAAVMSAEAQVAQMQATVKESSVNLARLRQVAELSGGKVPSKNELEAKLIDRRAS